MKSVGEVMAFGRNFQESFQKALRGLEIGANGLDEKLNEMLVDPDEYELREELKFPGAERLWHLANAMRAGFDIQEINHITGIDPWFLIQISDLVDEEELLKDKKYSELEKNQLLRLKRKGFSDSRLADLMETKENLIRTHRIKCHVRPVFKRVDTCAAEFATNTAYLYSTYEEECEADITQRKKIMILGGGPNRIGQGIEFDYCCVHAALL